MMRPSLPPSLAVRHKSLIGDGWLHAGGACHGYTYANNNRVEPIKKGGGSIAPLRRKENPSKKQKSILRIFLALRKCGSDCRSPGTTCCMRGRRKKIVASPPDLTTTYFHQIFPINFENFVFLQASLKEQIAMGDSEFHAALSCTYRKRGEESSQSGTYTYAGFFFVFDCCRAQSERRRRGSRLLSSRPPSIFGARGGEHIWVPFA